MKSNEKLRHESRIDSIFFRRKMNKLQVQADRSTLALKFLAECCGVILQPVQNVRVASHTTLTV
jgi:hypothetical protein